jgi:hypothetical protein
MRQLHELPLVQRDIYLSGYGAYHRGANLENNPLDHHSYLGILWDEGWADADEDARQDGTVNPGL